MILTVIPDARLCFEPRIGDAGGKPVANLRIATNARVKNAGTGEWESEAMFIDVALWRSVDTIEQYFHKGSAIVLHGELRPKHWTDKDGQQRDDLELANADWAFPPKAGDSGQEEAPRRRAAQKPAEPKADLADAFDDDVPW